MGLQQFTRIVTGFMFAITALMLGNAFLNPTPGAYSAAILWLVIAFLSHGVEKSVERFTGV